MKTAMISVASTGLPPAAVNVLDRNFDALAVKDSIVSTTTDGYTLRHTDTVVSLYVDTTVANLTIYLPDTPTGNQRRTVTKVVAANVLIVDGNGALIYGPGGWAAGVAQAFLNNQWESLTFEPTGTGWVIVACVP